MVFELLEILSGLGAISFFISLYVWVYDLFTIKHIKSIIPAIVGFIASVLWTVNQLVNFINWINVLASFLWLTVLLSIVILIYKNNKNHTNFMVRF